MGVQRSPKSSSFSGSKLFPPGFRFHPTDEELVLYYLKRKICRRRLKPDIIAETDVYKWDPDELPELSKLKTGDRQWFFLSPRDRRYPNGGRSNRATMRGYWKATGKDRTISCNLRSVGLKKTLVYYKGRAPSGERTDWVMHEYTLDEEELKRCPSAQDYYVLYKVYKKSGPGPKNGEQYGAPFKEEDWADDECVNFSGFLDQENTVKEADVSCIDDNKANNLPQDQVDDIDEFLKNIVHETAFVPPLTIDNWYTFDQVIAEKENVSTLVDHCSGEVSLTDRSKVPHQYQHSNVQTTSDHTQSLTSQLPIEAHEVVASATKNCEQGLGGILFEDFLEMDDLLGPQPSVPNSEKPPETLSSNGIDGLVEAELYNDVTMILRDMGQGGPGPVSQPYLPNPDSGMSNVASHSYLKTVENEAANHHAQPFHYEANPMSSELWAPEQRFNLFTPEENLAAFSHPISGVLCDGEGTRVIDNQSYTEDDGTFSWLSQWLESIPTTPASASESALVNKDFDRRFSLGRLKTKNANPSTISRRRGKKFIGGMLSFSVIGIVCAILWVLIGTFVKLLGRYVSS